MARRVFAVIPAAGTGSRMQAVVPKQYLPLAGGYLADHTLARLLAVSAIAHIQVALGKGDPHWTALHYASHPRVSVCLGGDTRAASVLAALQALQQQWAVDDNDWVLVHDMARPCIRQSDILRLLEVEQADGALLALPAVDSVKLAAPLTASNNMVSVQSGLDRARVWRALTPQFFPLTRLLEALNSALQAGVQVTDEASAMERLGACPRLIQGHADNIKVTHREDLPLAEFLLQQQRLEQEQDEL